MKCEVCDEEFETEPELAKHMTQMHSAGEQPEMEMPGKEAPGAEEPDEAAQPEYKRAVNE